MKNRLTFANVINILIENKKKTYPQHKLICDLFDEYLGKSDYSDTIYAEDNTMYSRWCTGTRPIPMEILRTYEDDDNFGFMETAFDDEIIPNLINESQARTQIEELINESIPLIGTSMADKLIAITDNAAFFTQVHMSTEKSVNRSLKIRSLLTWFGTCRIPSAGAVTT